MDFTFKEEQQQFADALRRWVDKDYTFETRKRIVHSPSGVSDVAWNTLAELGMTALPVPEEQGGFSGSAVMPSSASVFHATSDTPLGECTIRLRVSNV